MIRNSGFLRLAVGCLVLLLASPPRSTAAQERSVTTDSLWTIEMPGVVVTATRGARELRNVPVPTQVVAREVVDAQGATRLSDLLAEQTGLALVEDLGTGIQVQGLDAAYTLILIDGEPVIGRNGGTLDLDRLTVADIERVEIVRGPSSSLYGSEALAGVINLITRAPAEGVRAHTDVRYETHQTVDATVSAEMKADRLGARLLFNRYSSDGYDLFPDLIGLTGPGFTDYTASARLNFDQSASTTWQVTSRVAGQSQNSTSGLVIDGTLLEFDEQTESSDWSVAPQMVHRFTPLTKLTTRLYASGYQTDSFLRDRTGGLDNPGETHFEQTYGKGEAQLDAFFGGKHMLALGGGFIGEAVKADRVQGGRRTTTNVYGFVQHEWLPSHWLDVIASARLDVHSDYAARLSPKLAVLLKPSDRVRIRGSVGSGFKAPTFQQLYMDFTNPVAAYSVLGAVDVADAVRELEDQGQIAYYLTDPSTLDAIRPEHSVSYNLGLEWYPHDRADLRVNLFRNNVADLIETLPVATKTNGQNVFTYVNLNRIYTQGVDAEATLRPLRSLALTLGYQYLDARDRDVLDALDAGTIYKRVDGRDRRVRADEYGGLFDRSRHSGTLRLLYRNQDRGFTASVRGIYRGRFGYGDRNGNLILDDAGEYVPGYVLWNATLTQSLGSMLSVQFGVKNLFDETNRELVPSLPGRLLFAGLRFDLNP